MSALMKTCRVRHAGAIIPVLLLLLIAAETSHAATLRWTGAHGTSSDWSRGANWDTGTAPANDDILVFPAGAARLANNNDLTGLRVATIRFTGAGGGYTISGNAITLTDGINAINTTAGNTVALARITLLNPMSFTVATAGLALTIDSEVRLNGNNLTGDATGFLILRGVVSGDGNVIKTGTGLLTISGPVGNTFTGDLRVNAGSAFLGKTAGLAVTNRLIVGDGLGGLEADIAGMLADDQVNEVVVNSSGLWNLGNFTDEVSALRLNEGGNVDTGASGKLRLGPGAGITVAPAADSAPNISAITGFLELSAGTHTITVGNNPQATVNSSELVITAVISSTGLGGITKEGAGDVVLSGNNTFAGQVIVNAGNLVVNHFSALGATGTISPTTVNNDASVEVNADVGAEVLRLNSAGNPALLGSGTHSWAGDITLLRDSRIGVEPGGDLTLRGTISGTGNIEKENTGLLRIGGNAADNTFDGDLWVKAGTVELDKGTIGGLVAVPGRLIIGDGGGGVGADVVRHRKDNQVSQVTVNGTGLWDLGEFEEEVSDLDLLTGGDVTTAATGLLRLGIGADVTVTPGPTPATDVSSISGNLELLLGTHRFTVDNGTLSLNDARLTIDAVISGLGGITKEGLDILELTGANTFAGSVTVTAGSLYVGNTLALGLTSAGTQVIDSGALYLLTDVSGESLTLDTTGLTPAIPAAVTVAGDQSWTGPVTLLRQSFINVSGTATSLDLSGAIGGAGGITTIGPGTLILSGNDPNTFTGDLLVNAGTVELNKGAAGGVLAVPGRLIIGDGLGGTHADVARHRKNNQVNTVTVNGSGLWDLDTRQEEVSDLVLNDGGDVTTASTGLLRLGINANVSITGDFGHGSAGSEMAGNLELMAGVHRFTIDDNDPGPGGLNLTAAVSGLGGIEKLGEDDLYLYGANSFSGSVTVNAGLLALYHSSALGSALSGTRLNNDGRLYLQQNLTGPGLNFAGESLTLDSLGAGSSPTIFCGTDVIWSGPVTLLRDAEIVVVQGKTLELSGVVSGAGGITKLSTGTLLLSGNDPNTYAGVTTVNEGRLQLNKAVQNVAVPGRLIIGDDVGGVNADVVECLSVNEIGATSTVTVNSSGQFIARSESIGALAGSGNVSVSSSLNAGAANTTTVFHGVMSGAGAFNKIGTGTLTFNGNNTYTGGTGIADGTLLVNGQQPSSFVLIQPAGTLGGSGRVGSLSTFAGGATVSPGASPGRLSSGNVIFGSGTVFQVELDGPTPATTHDQLRAFGTVNLGGATLRATLNFIPTLGQPLVILDNDGTDAVVDQFNGLAEGDTLRVNQIPFVISYEGGDGNDVTLTATNRSLSLVSTRVEAGNGNGVIDPDECNHFFVALMNETGSPLAVSRVVLDSLTPGVVVTQQRSDYAPFGALDIRTNRAPFQIRTAPDFVCGQLIELALTVTLTGGGGGTFTIPFAVPSGGAGTPVQFDNGVNLNLPDLASATSTITVASAAPYVGKVTVSLHITHPSAGDLVLRLRSPSGTTVRLARNLGGTADNYGSGCGQASRTTFDDDAPVKIAAGTAPFIGAFVPEDPLTGFLGENPNGNWELLISDTVAGDTGVLRCWSLAISPPGCTDGGGECESCVPSLTGRFTADMPSTLTRLVRNGVPSGCGSPKACPSVTPGARLFYRVHLITNNGPETCVTAVLADLCRASNLRLHAAAYLGSYDPANPCANYLGDTGTELTGGSTGFSFAAPENAVIALVVSSPVTSTACPISYGVQLHGLPCPPPTLHIAKTGNPDEVRLHWSTAYPGFDLQRTPHLNGAGPYPFENVTAPPVVVNGDYSVTNSAAAQRSFYRLRKQ